MANIKQIMIQKGEDRDTRGFSIGANNVTYDDGVTELGASNVQGALEKLSERVDSKELDADSKMDKNNPNGSGSLSLNRKDNTAIGSNSAVIGYNNEASAICSVAEGQNTKATGLNAHSAGNSTEAAAANSIAVGSGTVARGNESIATGYETEASGKESFAGGTRTKSAGDNSFTYGKDNDIKHNNSHAIGIGLQPTVENEVVVGNYNNENALYKDTSPVFIVGVGTENNHKDGFVVTKEGTAIVNNDIQIQSGKSTISLKELNTKVKEGFYKELTQAQYNNLTDKEKNNGTVYYIKDSDPFDVAIDKVKLSRFGASDSSIKFGVDAEGNFGYIKPGADSVIPFNRNRTGSNLLNMSAPKVGMFYGSVLDIVEVKG